MFPVNPALLLNPQNPKAAGGGLMLDGITTGIKAAYSTRKLLTAYAGNAIQVQRASDNATQNIGFSSNVLDTSSLSTFCSGTTGRVITWYDQSGGGFNQTQSTFASAPIIYQSGAINFINTTRPAPLFVAATPTFLTNATLAQNPVNTLFMNAVAALTKGAIMGGTVSANTEWRVNAISLTEQLLSDITASLGTSSSGGNSTGSVYEVQYNSSTGAGSFWIDAATSGTFSSATTFAGGGAIQIGFDTSDGAGTGAADGSIGEIVMYDLVGGISSGSRTAIEANQKAYWGTP